jgi:RNA polymerase sigma factor (TIGR02999 family)
MPCGAPIFRPLLLKAQTAAANYHLLQSFFLCHDWPFPATRYNWRIPRLEAAHRMDPARNSSLEGEIGPLLQAWSDGDSDALEKLTPIVYQELHKLARHYMRNERSYLTLQTTALVNEAYLRLVDFKQMRFKDRTHFFAVSAQLMRRILVDHARRRNLKRGGGIPHLSLDDVHTVGLQPDADLVMLDDAMLALAQFDARKARVVELRFFGGLSVEETAHVLDISLITVMRDWNTARAWLYREMNRMSDQPAEV